MRRKTKRRRMSRRKLPPLLDRRTPRPSLLKRWKWSHLLTALWLSVRKARRQQQQRPKKRSRQHTQKKRQRTRQTPPTRNLLRKVRVSTLLRLHIAIHYQSGIPSCRRLGQPLPVTHSVADIRVSLQLLKLLNIVKNCFDFKIVSVAWNWQKIIIHQFNVMTKVQYNQSSTIVATKSTQTLLRFYQQ